MNWKMFVESMFRGDVEVMQLVQRLIGYAIAGDKSLGIIPVFSTSSARSGVSTFLEALKGVFGREMQIFYDHVIDIGSARQRANPFALMLREAKIVAFCGFGSTTRVNLVRQFKSLAACEMIQARVPYGKNQRFLNAATPFIVTNEPLPLAFRRDPALCERFVCIDLPGFYGTPDRDALLAIKSDPGAIVAWAAAGVRLWREEGLTIPDRFRLPVAGRRAA